MAGACHNPYFNRWFSAIQKKHKYLCFHKQVTILILIDGFLQWLQTELVKRFYVSHNPYFNRWFSAIYVRSKTVGHWCLSQSLF